MTPGAENVTPILGIDIAKESYHATLIVDGRRYQRGFSNRDKAFPELLK